MTVNRSKIFQAPSPGPQSQHGGSMQSLPNGGALVSYGGTNFIQEYNAAGTVVNALTIQGGSSFRAYKYSGWVATPAALPDVASIYNRTTNTTSVYMSWNGATEVASWRINDQFRVARGGFETLAVLSGFVTQVRAAALNATGTRIGRSAFVNTTSST